MPSSTTVPARAPAPPGRATEVAPGVHAYLQPPGGWCLNNAGIIVSGGESALVDTAATDSRARHLRTTALALNGASAPARSSTPTSTATTPSATTCSPRRSSSATNAPAAR